MTDTTTPAQPVAWRYRAFIEPVWEYDDRRLPDDDLFREEDGFEEEPLYAAQPPAAPVGLDVLRQMVQRQRDIPGMPPQQTGRPSGSNADEWNCFLSEHLNSTSFLAVQIAEAIEDGEKRGSLSRSSAGSDALPEPPSALTADDRDQDRAQLRSTSAGTGEAK